MAELETVTNKLTLALSLKLTKVTAMKLSIPTLIASLVMISSVHAQTSDAPRGPSPEMQAAHEAVMKACAADAKTLCADKEGREEMMCLRSNADKASAGCKDALAKMPMRKGPPPAP